MSGPIAQQTVEVTSPQGFHMRPVTAFAKEAARFQCEVTVSRDGRSVNGKSAWDMMTMLSPPGALLTVQAVGTDAPSALEALIPLINSAPEDETPPQ